MARLYVKINTAGSWGNLVSCDPARLEFVKVACESLAIASGGHVSFKVVDADGTTLEHYNHTPRPGQPCGWQPARQP